MRFWAGVSPDAVMISIGLFLLPPVRLLEAFTAGSAGARFGIDPPLRWPT